MEEKKKEEKPEEQIKEPESAFPEALLEFQIKTKEAAIDRVLFDLKQVEKKNKEYHKRNDLLKEEQQAHIRRMLRKIKEEKKKQDEKEVVTRDDVEDLLKAKWKYVKDKEQLLKDLHSQIEETAQKLSVKQSERDFWLEYKNVGSETQANKIMNLEKDIKEVKDNLHRTTEYYTNTLKAVKEENDRLLERHMELSKEQAHENALRCLDKNSRREIEENEWLKEEIKMYQKEVSDLKASINLLEEENIGLVTKLVNSRLQNLKAHRHLFLTQTAGLQDEFPKDEMKEAEYRKHAAKTDGDENLRSDTVSCQKKKAFPKIQSKTENEKPQDSDEELWEKSFTPPVDSLLYKAEEDFQEYLKLGPLETKLMCVVGRAMPIHEEPEEMPSRSHTEDGVIGKSDGHITAQMIKALSKEKVGEK
ncbi:coiled-coil domain-containing protein 83 isoform X1 [Falco biarmicus]|uniref:coiled-coil domain-containing protein 83 isoform X1 n=1 Tax=Falco cherrug TaxID=345164 RepID=UPI002479E8AD|nr:coiled-coil domain-containing protein 83 isoform X1 [Falco cherrug]XP_055557659.1 coiled-coil domain-containing protein 83 isoform X1 [Falco cherrug]XP_055557660.1 coiled-coil domain-containing protein 83 isoform X1 [Falco cherrug]XP_056183754.1 coiled-coil domain-containing protein 83 isoform X1 [Falco biarmicus]XP_056183755.1 coiled-coil domain-containing protein 83 isoform X1 [Falco biarmicus]XP_056183757.1 coiled-coil domain-containing protein 83 isoform X1 [Falco biarmicus]